MNQQPEYGDNEPIPASQDNEETGSYPNIKTGTEIKIELGLGPIRNEHGHAMSHDPYHGEKK